MPKNLMKETDYYKSGRMYETIKMGAKAAGDAAKAKSVERRGIYDQSPNLCTYCNQVLPYSKRHFKFCNRSCSASFNNQKRTESGFSLSPVSRHLISQTIKETNSESKLLRIRLYEASPCFCKICKSVLPYQLRHRKTCQTSECKHLSAMQSGQKGGLKTASGPMAKRSKNEIKFYDLCQNVFQKVTANDPIFDGWDADVLIHDYKIAVLWNGDWHYREMGCYNHKLQQVQNRDLYKQKLICRHGWKVYIVKDTSDNPTTPEDALNSLVEWIKNYQK